MAAARQWSGSGSDSEAEENVGQWSPPPVDPALVGVGQDVVHEDDDARMLELLRAQVLPIPPLPPLLRFRASRFLPFSAM